MKSQTAKISLNSQALIYMGTDEVYDSFTQNVKLKVKIKSYSPSLFKTLRELDGMSEQEILNSLMPSNNREQIFKTNQN